MVHQKKTQRQVFIEDQTKINKAPTWRVRGQKRAHETTDTEEQGSSRKKGADGDEDRRIMLKFEEEMERRLRHKVANCKASNGDLDALFRKESSTTRLETGIVTDAEKAAGYPATTIENCINKVNRKEKSKSFERWNSYVTSNFCRIVSEVEEVVDTPELNDQPEVTDLEGNANEEQKTIRTFSTSFNGILRPDLPEDIRQHIKATLINTVEETLNYIIEYSLIIRKLMLSFSDSTFSIGERGKVSLIKKNGFQLADILPIGFDIKGETQFVAPSLNATVLSSSVHSGNLKSLFNSLFFNHIHSHYFGVRGPVNNASQRNPFFKAITDDLSREETELKCDTFTIKLAMAKYVTDFGNLWSNKKIAPTLFNHLFDILLEIHLAPKRMEKHNNNR